MCGIAGIYQFKNADKEELKETVGKMNRLQARRGPDDEGIFIDEKNGVVLGHRRLSILDLSAAGQQPMIWRGNDGGEIAIVFNGEIYNFLELKKDLRSRGCQFKTQTDTEVILALYNEYGEKSFGMLRGMFAFGLYDVGRRKLFLVKDRYGIKPLYYYSDSKKFIFASTVKALKKSGIISLQKNPEAYIGFLLFGSVPLPMTTIKNVLAVPAGHYLVRGENGEQKLVQYYDALEAFQKKSKDNFEEAKLKIKNLLRESINLHLISDAPLGVFLSGGLDSSVIAALAAQAKGDKIKTLSIIFEEKEFSEQKYQRLVAQKIKSDHREIKITKKDFFGSFDEIFEAMDQPTIDGINTFFIAKAAKEAGLKVVLSGLGGDEIFCGYPSFRKVGALRKIQNLPRFLKSPLKLGNLFGSRYSKLSYFANDDVLSFYLGIRGLFLPQEVAKILDINLSEVENFIEEFYSQSGCFRSAALRVSGHGFSRSEKSERAAPVSELAGRANGSEEISALASLHPVDLLSCLELRFYLQNQLLKDTDFMSMCHSIEVRIPFLDHLLVEYLSGLSPKIKISGNVNKALLVEAARDLLPQEIFNRPKMGFTFPFEKWFKEEKPFSGHWSRFWAKEVLKKF